LLSIVRQFRLFESRELKEELMTQLHSNAPAGGEVGQIAPDFGLKDESGQPWRLSDHRGKVVALIFYPKDETPVCTKQMCSMRDRWEDYEATGAEVVAISVGSVESHRQFADHFNLPQRLLADERGEVADLYNVRSLLGGSQRAVIVIDTTGIVHYRKTMLPIFRPNDDQLLNVIRGAAAGPG
jgi:peroxiredoxin Q/BCP